MQKTVTDHQTNLDRLRVRMKDAKTVEDLVVYSHKKFWKVWSNTSNNKSKEAIMTGLSSVKTKSRKKDQ